MNTVKKYFSSNVPDIVDQINVKIFIAETLLNHLPNVQVSDTTDA